MIYPHDGEGPCADGAHVIDPDTPEYCDICGSFVGIDPRGHAYTTAFEDGNRCAICGAWPSDHEIPDDGPCIVCGAYGGDHDPGCMINEEATR
jgi:hypothetical protein